jgi:hypothetical protein
MTPLDAETLRVALLGLSLQVELSLADSPSHDRRRHADGLRAALRAAQEALRETTATHVQENAR